jgi:RHS repeat-associated protein
MATVSNSAYVAYASFSGYNAFGQPGLIGFQNGVKTTLTYDPYTNRLSEMSTSTPGNGTVQDFVYSYDNDGNILTITDNVDPTRDQTFTYDRLSRLASATGAYGKITYSTDEVGNVANPPDTSDSAYRDDRALVYDYENRILSVGSTSFSYDYQGARVKKTNGIDITTYVSKLYEINTTGGVTKHIFAGGRRIASINGSTISYYHPDHLGSLNIATNASGAKVQEVTYYPYGEVLTNQHSGIDLPYKFTGHEFDIETRLYYCGARYYDPAQGRFLTPDTIVQSPGDPQTLTR